jgi:predicted ArsR family transcriptional regulator
MRDDDARPDAPDRLSMVGAGLGDTQKRLLEILKREGELTVRELAGILGFAAETVRGHLKTLAGHGLVARTRTRKEGPGRPEIVYGLAERAERLFPSEEGRLLRDLTAYLVEDDRDELLRDFFESRVESLRENAERRLEGLTGRDRVEEVAAILEEEGFMPELVEPDNGGGVELRLCHCPLKEMVAVSHLPCEAEESWIRELLGESLARRTWMPDGDRTCSYRVG